jgi:hypothetical protein
MHVDAAQGPRQRGPGVGGNLRIGRAGDDGILEGPPVYLGLMDRVRSEGCHGRADVFAYRVRHRRSRWQLRGQARRQQEERTDAHARIMSR